MTFLNQIVTKQGIVELKFELFVPKTCDFASKNNSNVSFNLIFHAKIYGGILEKRKIINQPHSLHLKIE